ncbi:ferritin [candidate division WOR-1 bacterium RIFCSPHIGHO2_01_FULL_53_15]|uniref:Bacterioferritin n=1 Tax=candidate division WOR-1 bacterium RIFCSPHIGHO2_01_FULL_53_15 TaxID=1802564 RepID=A0A1F4Q2J0_UNCSA|nr:MAG: ferritin [candidate division WOR-1 bacterium RIFCSPHIGHO2_01_FULL_53_15]OGC13186.1 MAG: ferritin [candidate division WOR-1 bacterium RIFCSPHIGHO2_02_FULL_53_26]
MASEKLKDLLNKSIARELQVVVQYMWQHVLWSGVKGYAVKDQIKSIAVTEMKHAEAIAERLNYLGGIPTTKPEPIFVGESLKEMLAQDQKDERVAIKLYNEVIAVAKAENDEATYKLFQGILSDEEDHDDFFTTALEEV